LYLKKQTNIPQIIDINAIIWEYFGFDLPGKLNKKDKETFFIFFPEELLLHVRAA